MLIAESEMLIAGSPMPNRTLVIGDVHGCLAALDAVLDACRPDATDTVVALGDYIDRGPDSRGVLDRLLLLAGHCRLVPILGNHDEMLLSILAGHYYLLGDWIAFGGDATLASYEGDSPDAIPSEHVAFLQSCQSWYETPRHFYVHASYLEDVPLTKQPLEVLRWASIRERLPGPHRSGKIAVVGHTSQKGGRVFDVGYLKCIDTYVYGDGCLTAMDVDTGRLWQADKDGRLL